MTLFENSTIEPSPYWPEIKLPERDSQCLAELTRRLDLLHTLETTHVIVPGSVVDFATPKVVRYRRLCNATD